MTPKEVFQDSFRLAELLLHIYRLLENEGVITEGELLSKLRNMVGAGQDEQLLMVLNSIFLGLIREEANMPVSTLKPQSLSNLLRQAVVSGCTAYETYLAALLARHIYTVIEVKQHEFFPNDPDVNTYFQDLSLSIGEAFRLLSLEERTVFLGSKIVTFVQKKNLGSVNGLKTVGLLLGLEEPWKQVADHLKRDNKEIRSVLRNSIERRNAIVHKGDRKIEGGSMEREPITFSWTRQAVDTVGHVCFAFDELVESRMKQYDEILKTRRQQVAV